MFVKFIMSIACAALSSAIHNVLKTGWKNVYLLILILFPDATMKPLDIVKSADIPKGDLFCYFNKLRYVNYYLSNIKLIEIIK